MEESIFDGIKNKIKDIFHKEEESSGGEMLRIEPEENLADPLESRMTEEYVSFLEETEGGNPLPEEPEEESVPEEESRSLPEEGQVEETEEAAPLEADEKKEEILPGEAFWPDDDPWEEAASNE